MKRVFLELFKTKKAFNESVTEKVPNSYPSFNILFALLLTVLDINFAQG